MDSIERYRRQQILVANIEYSLYMPKYGSIEYYDVSIVCLNLGLFGIAIQRGFLSIFGFKVRSPAHFRPPVFLFFCKGGGGGGGGGLVATISMKLVH